MKKLFFFGGIALVATWIAGFFLGMLSGVWHILLFLGVLFYLRSMMIVDLSDASTTKLENGDN